MEDEHSNEGNQWNLEVKSQSEFYKFTNWVIDHHKTGNKEFAVLKDREDILNVLNNLTRLGKYVCVRDYAGMLKADNICSIKYHPKKKVGYEAGLATLICGGNCEFDSYLTELWIHKGQCSDDPMIMLIGESSRKLSFQDVFFRKPSRSIPAKANSTKWIDTTRTLDPILIYPHGSRYEKHDKNRIIHPENFARHKFPPQLPVCFEEELYKVALRLCYGVAAEPR